MQELLAARKSSDIMTPLSLYQEHVDNSEALERQIDTLAQQWDSYEPTS